MRPVCFSGIPGRRARAAVLDNIFPKYVFIPLFIIFAAACLLLAGCTDDPVVAPDDDNDTGTNDPVCPEYLPSVTITVPAAEDGYQYPQRVTFTFNGAAGDMIARTRHLITKLYPGERGTDTLNAHPELFEDLWTEWETLGPEGRSVTVGEDSLLDLNRVYMFAVQAIDSCGKMTEVFIKDLNTKQFLVVSHAPILSVFEKNLGTAKFRGIYWQEGVIQIPPLLELQFTWEATSDYSWFDPIEYRCGWDIQNMSDDDEWSAWSDHLKTYPEERFSSGVHVFYIEARDELDTVTRARIEIEIIPFPMDRDLLWIDDYPLGGYVPSMTDPSEDVHDEFWTSLCSRVPGFDPAIDIYEADVYNRGSRIPLSVFANYKNIVWTYSTALDIAWSNSINFDPYGIFTVFTPDNFRMFLAAGGNALTCGRSERSGGLGEVFPLDVYYPASVTDELADMGYEPDHVKYALPHDYYNVTVLDKVYAMFKTGMEVPRSLDRDALRMAVEAENTSGLDFPDTLMLDETVTCPACFFNPQARGFIYVEVYDPAYYMEMIGASSHPGFSPIYTIRTRSSISPINNEAIALRVTSGTSPYDSYHFGFPLWFMEHEKVEQIMDEIFRSWEIR